jgi:hypothetical protein
MQIYWVSCARENPSSIVGAVPTLYARSYCTLDDIQFFFTFGMMKEICAMRKEKNSVKGSPLHKCVF